MEDDDIKLHRATAYLLNELELLIPEILWKTSADGSHKLHRYIREKDFFKAKHLIEPFQEDPQLLDAKLKSLVTPLIEAFVTNFGNPQDAKPKGGYYLLYDGICKILYLFCKVRGEKIIVGFFNNEPRYLEPILLLIENRTVETKDHEDENGVSPMAWEERYISFLWLSHLMLTPFDLSTISSKALNPDYPIPDELSLPTGLSEVVIRVLSLGLKHLGSVTKERAASATAIVKLCMRPDMRKFRLMERIMDWTLSSLKSIKFDANDDPTYQVMGYLSLANGIVASASGEDLGRFIPPLHNLYMKILNDESFAVMRSSAVARKLVIKISRNVVVHTLKMDSGSSIDPSMILEDVIDVLLQSLGDGDTPVRFAASKALSMITMKLEADMGEEVIDAVLGLLNKDVIWTGSERDYSLTNPLEWHGIALTLAHLVYRRAPPPQKLPEVINALLLALTYEQRSMTGGSIGTNVRDAANFGVWALSRRYVTSELLQIDASSVQSTRFDEKGATILQNIAIELILSACLDPAGNIRRGSSAALQELIGRHPDQIHEGIPLVQVVDYQAVSLRGKAMCDVGVKASALHDLYWQALLSGLLTWRGIGALDAASRRSAAKAIGMLVASRPKATADDTITQIRAMLKGLKKREVEDRHGLLLAAASILNEFGGINEPNNKGGTTDAPPRTLIKTDKDAANWIIWDIFKKEVKLNEEAFMSIPLRPALTAEAVCSLLTAICDTGSKRARLDGKDLKLAIPPYIAELLNFCFRRSDEKTVELVPDGVRSMFGIASDESRDGLIEVWLQKVRETANNRGRRNFGVVVALGALFEVLGGRPQDESNVLDILAQLSEMDAPVDRRVMAVQSLGHVIKGLQGSDHPQKLQYISRIIPSIITALNDYTVNERGDVGSLVRIEGIRAAQTLWGSGKLNNLEGADEIYAAILRLSVEKLDKTRMLAAEALLLLESDDLDMNKRSQEELNSKVASYAYFRRKIALAEADLRRDFQHALLEGYINSAGIGSEALVLTSRRALVDALNAMLKNSGPEKLSDIFTVFSLILKESNGIERVVLSLLEVISFLFDAQIFQTVRDTDFKWRNLLALVQKAHYKSTNMQKLSLSLAVYRGLLEIPVIRRDVLAKLVSMLLHPFPKIRVESAEVLYLATGKQELKSEDWFQSPKDLKPVVENLRKTLL